MEAHSALDKVRIAILASHAVVRAGFRYVCSSDANLVMLGEASTLAEALQLLAQAPDVIVVDPDSDDVTLDAIATLSAAGSWRVLVLTSSTDTSAHKRAFELGAVGVIQKDQPTDMLVRAIMKVHAGELWLDRVKTARLLTAILRPRDPEDLKIQSLTKREREVISLVGQGLKNAAIAEQLFISAATARNHLTSILSKLELTNRFELAVYSFRKGLVDKASTHDPMKFGAASRMDISRPPSTRRTERISPQ